MADDLKKQASELYREQAGAERIPTSDSLSMKRVFYITIAIAAAALLGIQLFGGFRRRPDPVVAANTPPPLVKEAPPPGMLEGPAPPPAQGQVAPPAAPASQPQEAAKPAPAPVPPPPPRVEEPRRVPSAPAEAAAPGEPRKPVLTRDTEPRPSPTRRGAAPAGRSAQEAKAEAPAAPPAPPKLSDIEIARRELAREIVLEKNPALAKLVAAPNSNAWSAQPEGTDEYLVSFSIVDEGAGAPVQYVWRVNVTTRSTTPLSYYARRLS